MMVQKLILFMISPAPVQIYATLKVNCSDPFYLTVLNQKKINIKIVQLTVYQSVL